MNQHSPIARPVPLPSVVDRFPCTQSQQRFWLLEQMAPGNTSANVALCWELRGSFQAETIEKAFRQVIDRHEILRTRFVEEDSVPLQEVVDHCDFKLSVVDLRTVPADQLEKRVASISKEEARISFDLSRACLLRATLLQLAAGRAYLLITVHHLCFDGMSIRVLGREIGEILDAADNNRAAELPELALQYGDFALWEEAHRQSADFETERSYWRDKLADAPYFELPTDKPRDLERSHAGAAVSVLLSNDISSRIDGLSRSEGVSVFSLSAAILAAVLHRWTGKTDIAVGTQIAGRDETELETLLGVFINNIVLRFAIEPDAGFQAHLAAANGIVRDALVHQHMPFNTLVEMLNPPRDPARTPLFSVNMIVQKAFMEDHRYKHFEMLGRPSSTPGALFDLNFMMIGRPEGWRATIEYNPDLFDATTADRLLADWTGAIETLTANPARSIAELPVTFPAAATAVDQLAPAAIEALLLEHAAVAAVKAVDTSNGAYRLLVVPDPSCTQPLETLPATLLDHLSEIAPALSRPISISLVMQLPADVGESLQDGPAKGEVEPATNAHHDALEAVVSELWRDLLGLTDVDRTANFFDLGGHSLLAVRLIAKLRERLNVKLTTTALYRAPTIETLTAQLAALAPINAVIPEEDTRIHDINPDAPGIPIISINNYSTIYAISKHFSTPRRSISVRLVDPDAPFEPDNKSFEQIADAYVELVKRVQPQGPYALFGVCVHGNIALEVARRLIAGGDEVAGLFIKDVWAPAYSAHVRDNRKIRLLNKVHDGLLRLRRWRRGELSMFDVLRYYPIIRSRRLFLAMERFFGNTLEMETRLLSTTSQGAFVSYLAAARNRYMPETYPGDVVMFKTNESPAGRHFDISLGWKAVVSGKFDIAELEEIVVSRGVEIGTVEAAARIEATLTRAEGGRA
ncbi:condensation domain-containing protein [Tianweitania sp.]|uniref:condensation domain-containing protein n=1 Tax=Tianweitania sp. TaxID=2021634 RepID=UPI0028A2D6CC|nr:condensation domain-containing protein [Tianweitania sp.]